MKALFNSLPPLPPDPLFGLNSDFLAETRPNKVDLAIGAYKTAEGKSYLLSSVKKAESLLPGQKDYLSPEGYRPFIQEGIKLIFGGDRLKHLKNQLYAIQTVGGCGALSLGGDLLFSRGISSQVFIPDPSWSNHQGVFQHNGLICNLYPYYDSEKKAIDVNRMCEAIRSMQSNDLILLHACCHNPTGIDPSRDEWKQISNAIKARGVIPFFDQAYQGFGQGLQEDGWAVNYFADQGHQMLVASSFSKNFGLYNERVGLLTVVGGTPEAIPLLSSHLQFLVRRTYSNPPAHGAQIVATILQSKTLRQEWEKELKMMRKRVQEMRTTLVNELEAQAKGDRKGDGKDDFSYLRKQLGLFSYTGLSKEQVHQLRRDYAIYFPDSGRINVAGLNPNNLDYVVNALLAVRKV
jgi:aspartate/tyrosine/aromatic aminotransferase